MGRPERLWGWLGLLLGLGAVLLGAYFMRSVYRRVETRFALAVRAYAVEGAVTEKLAGSAPDSLLPFEVPLYTVRYAFPNLQGVMRSGEQEVTRASFNRLPPQGGAVTVWVSTTDPSKHGVDIRPAFPGAAGWRLGIGVVLLIAGAGLLGFSSASFRAHG